RHHLGDIENLDFFLRVACLDPIGDHDRAKWARHGGDLSSGRQNLIGAIVVHAGANLLFHPHASTAAPAAEAMFLGAIKLDDAAGGRLSAAHVFEDGAWSVVLAVPSAEVATVVIREAARHGLRGLEAPLRQ